MKILLITLCAFLFTIEAYAQEWKNISPKGAKLESVKAFKDRFGNLQILATKNNFQESILYHYSGKNNRWDSISAIIDGYCNNSVPVYYGFRDIVAIQDNMILFNMGLMYRDGCSGYTRNGRPILTKKIFSIDSLSMISAHLSSIDTIISRFSIPPEYNLKYYRTIGRDSLETFDAVTLEQETHRIPKDLFDDEANDQPFIKNDPRDKNTFYYKKLLYKPIGGTETITEQIFKTTDNGKSWKIVYSSPEWDINRDEINFIWDFYLSRNSSEAILLNTDAGLFYYNERTKKLDTSLRFYGSPVEFKENYEYAFTFSNGTAMRSTDFGRSWDTVAKGFALKNIVFLEGTPTAYGYSVNGKIYRSDNTGLTWDLFSSGLEKNSILQMYASGFDSLIITTSTGIWANYSFPVSVTEEIPFKNIELTITPNPANTSLKISFFNTELPQQLSIYNSLGQLVFKTEFFGEFVWDFKSDVPDGIYTVAVQSGGKSVAKQVVILR
ncbi:MAG: T9SS type A sorting domain-containing protein [Bacteroidota bacterium]